MDAVVLAYNFEGAELKKLKKLCAGKGIRARAVAPEDWGQPVGALCLAEKRVQDAPASAVEEKMLVLARLTQRQLDSLLAEMRTARVGAGALKAVLTASNAAWNADRLCRELRREREAVNEA